MCLAVLTVLTAQAQIGYKGQIMVSVNAGISQSGGCVATGRVGAYLSPRSILGAGVMFDRSDYAAPQGDSFAATQWFGTIHYQYAVTLNRFVLLPAGGLLLGGEHCAAYSRRGNRLPYDRRFVYGLFVELGMEYVFGRHWAMVFEPRLHCLMRTNFDRVKISGNIGVKYYF